MERRRLSSAFANKKRLGFAEAFSLLWSEVDQISKFATVNALD